ncbi:MAG: penicillin-binding protein 2 [Actinomycetota bacterium]|nr:penicillin-binding protein 2 [Actinomycetota bacterium]
MFFVFTLAFMGMASRLFVLQIVEGPGYAKLAVAQRDRVIEFPARRGAILDREGEPLAISVDLHTVWTDPQHVTDPAGQAVKLAPVLGLDARELAEKLACECRFQYLARQVGPKVAQKVKKLDLPGIYLEAEPKRYYPGRRLASHVLGFVDIDGRGLEGIEAQYDGILQGTPGSMTLEQDPAGHALPQAEFKHERPRPGRSLLLTIDKELQYFTQATLAEATSAFSADGGTAIVMRPQTGEILALANVPDFDPNNPGGFSELDRRNRAVTDVYEPGSAYKIVTASGALEEKVVTPRTPFVVPDSFAYSDRVFHDSHPHPTEKMTVAEIIHESSNVGTIQIGLKLGGKKLDAYVRRFGFGSKTGLDFPGESPGIVLDRSDWSGPTIATIPIGQGIAVTPLQMAVAYSTIANEGVWVEPKLLAATMADNARLQPSPPPATRRVVSRATAQKVTKILAGVTEKGTGIEAQIPGYAVAGKTGTAQKPLDTGGYGNSYIGSFAGFAPANRPAVVVIVVLDEPSPIWGGSTAAPTFKTIMQFALRHLGVAPTGNAERAAREIQAEQAGDAQTYD